MQDTPLTNWRLAVVPHDTVRRDGFAPTTTQAVRDCPYGTIRGEVPGNFELDLMREGILPDLYYADNVLLAQEYEDRHLWYAADFTVEAADGYTPVLVFGGIDTAAEIYLDGELLGKTENMLIPYEYPLAVAPGDHGVVVHIIPAQVYTRQFPLPVTAHALPYNLEQLKLRKTPHMYGWDILPRIVSGGLWRPVVLHYRPNSHIDNVFVYTADISGKDATLGVVCDWNTDAGRLQEYSLLVEGKCGDAGFSASYPLYSTHLRVNIPIKDAALWWPKNYGEPRLYDITVTLLRGDAVCDRRALRTGIRTVELERTSFAGDDGEFVFRVNGKKIFCMGTNWVPADAFPSRDRDYLLRGLELADDLGCNIIRCWGGNIYPDDLLYDFCDEHGILIWQDMSMACGCYPQDERICRLIREETTAVVRRLRNHPSILLWSGDNECDEMTNNSVRCDGRRVHFVDPNGNGLTRRIIPAVLAQEDFTRPYLPSSPYADERAAQSPDRMTSEAHIWGPRDFFKGEFYTGETAHFASEIGYHGCPSPTSLRRMFTPEALKERGDGTACTNREWLAKCVSPGADKNDCYAYRNPLMHRQVERLFGTAAADIADFARQSQISQAEAKKYFIERFRIAKWRKTGIIWWNVIDGWPQISDAVVDWFGCKKLAYHYIKRSQQPFCMMCDEPRDGMLTPVAVNDLRRTVTVCYTISAVSDGRSVASGKVTVAPDETVRVAPFPQESGEVYRIRWSGDMTGENHFTAGIADTLDYEKHKGALQTLGYWDEFEGF